MEPPFADYKLPANVFDEPLKPLTAAAHAGRVVRVDGFSRLDDAFKAISKTVGAKGPSFFMVSGRDGTGRSCAAGALVVRYRDELGADPGRFVVPEPEVDDHDVYAWYKSWFKTLVNRLRKLPQPPAIPDSVIQAIKDAEIETMGADLADIAEEIEEYVNAADPKVGFACFLRGVKSFKYVAAAQRIFKHVNTVCVFTVADYDQLRTEIIDPFANEAGAPSYMPLSPLNGEQAAKLIVETWKHHTALPAPFTPEGLTTAFANVHLPAQRVVWLMRKTVAAKVIARPKELIISEDELRGYLTLFGAYD